MFMNSQFAANEVWDEINTPLISVSPRSIGIDATSRLATRSGRKTASDLKIGDEVLSFDNGFRRIQSIRKSYLPLHSDSLPVYIPVGAIGNLQDFIVPERQVLMIENDQAERLFGDPFALVRAEDLIGFNGVCRMIPHAEFELVTLNFGTDEVIFGANGELFYCPCTQDESYSPGFEIGGRKYDVLSSHVVTSLTSFENPLS